MFSSDINISIDTVDMKVDWITCKSIISFSGDIELNLHHLDSLDLNEDEEMLVISRELIKQLKIMYALTTDKGYFS